MLWILVSSRTSRDRFFHHDGPLEFGRGPRRDVPRKVLQDPTVSTNQLCLEEQEEDRVRLCNLSTKVTVRLADGSLIEPGGELIRAAAGPASGRRHAHRDRARHRRGAGGGHGSLEDDRAAGRRRARPTGRRCPSSATTPVAEELARWFESLIGVQRAAASSPDFFAETAQAVVELIGLDSGLVLLRREGALGARGLPSPARATATASSAGRSWRPSPASGGLSSRRSSRRRQRPACWA